MSHHHEGCCKHEGQPRHEGCCKGEKSEYEHCGHGHQHEHGQCCGGRHGRGGGRRQRFFGHGELRLVILDILSRDDSHGYELIKAIENLTRGITPQARASSTRRWIFSRAVADYHPRRGRW